jgi:beta-lactamase regulating signal transducer with metallopeptidase domain
MNSSAIIPLLAELLIKSAAILIAAGLFHTALYRISAAKRHYIWAGAFVALLLLPLTKLASPLWPIELNKPRSPEVVLSGTIGSFETVATWSPSQAPVPVIKTKAGTSHLSWQSFVIVTWIAGGVLMLGYQLLGRLQLTRLKRCSLENDDAGLDALLCRAAGEASIRRPVALRISNEVRVPVTWGVWRPILLLPMDWQKWNEGELIAMLRHELAHIARNDCMVRRLTQFVTALYWPNPLVWIAASTLRSAQEQACDDRVLQCGTSPTDYASLLFESVRALSRQDAGYRQALAMARPSTLEKRVVAIVNDMRDRRPGGLSGLLTALSIVAAALTLSAFAQVANEARPPAAQSETTEAQRSPDAGLPGLEPVQAGSAQQKAESIIIPKVDFRGATLLECLEFLKRKSIDLDPKKEGVNIVVNIPKELPNTKALITLNLRNVTLSEAVKYVTGLANCRYRYDERAIVIVDVGDGSMRVREYIVPASLVSDLERQNPEAFEVRRFDMAKYLTGIGVTFPEGASAVYIHLVRRLIVRNTDENLDLVDAFVKATIEASASEASPSQTLPSERKLTKIIIPKLEFRETNLKESIEFLSKKVKDLDPEKTGVTMEVASNVNADENRITISLLNIPAFEALKYVTSLAGVKFRVTDDDRVVIQPLNTAGLITKLYRVPANSISTKEGTVKGPDGVTYPSAHDFLATFGVTFPEGASAALPVTGKQIVVRNTQDNLDISDVIMATLVEANGAKLPDNRIEMLHDAVKATKERHKQR